MKENHDKEQGYIRAKNKVKKIRMFYIHVLGYIIVIVLLLWNLTILEGPYKDFFLWFNSIIMLAWTVFIILHWWNVFRGGVFFRKKWENKKMEEYMKEDNETTMWE